MPSSSYRRLIATVALSTQCLFGCDSSTPSAAAPACHEGERLCACFANHTCNPGLECRSDTCVDVATLSSGGAATSSSPGVAEGGQSTSLTATSPDAAGGGASPQPGTGGATATGTAVCATGSEACTCYANDTCNAGLTCLSRLCVALGPLGGAGASATGGAPAAGGAASIGSATATGGATTAATLPTTGGAVATGGTHATGGVPATGGTSTTTTAIAPSGGAAASTVGTTAVNNSPIIDAFASCDDRIENNGGRSGKWYTFADSDFNMTHGFGDPGTQWADHGCAAWIIMGCTGTACTYAGIGFQLADGNPYDLSSYSGFSVAFEGKDNVYVVVKTSDGGYFGTWISGTTGNQTRNVSFADLTAMASTAVTSLNPRLITEIQFTIGKTVAEDSGAGFAVHSVSLR